MDSLEILENEAKVWQTYIFQDTDLQRDILSVCAELRAARAALREIAPYEPVIDFDEGWEKALLMVGKRMKEAREAVEAQKSG